ncbi:MAG: FAD/NAD(P)-binding protein [Gemmataceae bacterium]
MPTSSPRLLELVQRLDALGPEPSLAAIARVMESAPLTVADVADYVRIDRQSYHRALVIRRDQYEILVMTWLPGQASVPHDHTGSVCAMQIVQGDAVEGCYCIGADGYADLEYETVVREGEVTAGQDAGIHTVRNPAETGEPLVTVHVYAPPLEDFRRFVPRPAGSADERYADHTPTVVVVGGGFSGAMTAAQLLRAANTKLRVALVERRGSVGEGIAYGTRELVHLLNVSAGRMSAWPDQPDHFVRWAEQRHGSIQAGDFLPRQWYGEYVRESLHEAARESAAAELSVVLDEVRRVARHPDGGWMVHLGRGTSLRAEAVVLAIGHRPPSDPICRMWTGPRDRFIADPWRPFAVNQVGSDQPVLILGSGLTAVDAVLSLSQRPRTAPITLVSRHGLLPQSHAATPVPPADLSALVNRLIATPGGPRAATLARELRAAVRERPGADWRSVVDGLRPHTATLWQALSAGERRRFLAHLRPIWEVHRHRTACHIADRLRTLLDNGSVRIVAGRVASVMATGEGVRVTLRERGSDRLTATDVAWVINCTGPTASNSAESNPVIGSLLVHNLVRPDELSLGLETTPKGNAVGADGREVPDLFVVGTLRKPATWESTAVPELRAQAAAVGERIAQWIGTLSACPAAPQPATLGDPVAV